MKTWKLVSGILSIILFVIVTFQSCAAGVANSLEANGETSGSAGVFVAILMLAGGIVSVATRNSEKKGGNIALIVALGLAEELGIPVQDAVRSAGSTNGAAIHLTEKAVPVIVIGVPVRYAHTHYGISAYADFDNAVKLACEILKRLDEKLIMSF